MEDKITVIVPAYNVEQYLEKCLDSILSQDFEKLEVIVVDDGSTDDSPKIAEAYKEKYPNIVKVLHQSNRGLGGARNTGIKNATGKYILFVDSDDTIKAGMLSTLYNTIEIGEADIIFFGIEYVDEEDRVLARRQEFEEEYLEFTLQEQPYIFVKDAFVCDKMYRTELFTKNNIYFLEGVWYEDLNVESKLILYTKKMIFINKSFYKYLQRNGSIMHNKNIEKNEDMIRVVEDILEYYKNHGVYEKYRDQLELLVAFHVMTLCTLRISADNPWHPLLKSFWDYSKTQFPQIGKTKTTKQIPKKYEIIFKISNMKQYWILWFISKLQWILKNRRK